MPPQPLPLDGKCFEGIWDPLPAALLTPNQGASPTARRRTVWRAAYDDQAINVGVVCRESERAAKGDKGSPRWNSENIELQLEPQRLWPCLHFRIDAQGN